MKLPDAMSFRGPLPLPGFVLHPLTALVIAAVHVYLAAGHLTKLIGGDVQWTHIWKGFGAIAGAYVFAALASRGLAHHSDQHEERLEADFLVGGIKRRGDKGSVLVTKAK
jgi:hypothetical protein